MHALKSIVRWFFAIQAAVLILLPLAAIFGGLRKHLLLYLGHATSAQAHRASAEAAAYGLVVGMLAAGLLFAAAWWTTRKPSPANRVWAIAASAVNVVQGVVLLLASHLTRGRISFSPGDGLWCIALGVAGLFLFVRVGEAPPAAAGPVERKSVAGDRTSAITRKAVTALSCVAQIAGIVIWGRWAYAHNLSRAYGIVWVALITIASVLTTVIHECGHALIAWCCEMKLLSFKAGPFQWMKREGKWQFKLYMGGLLTPGGAVGAVSNDPKQPRWEEILMIAAGPLANLLIGIPAIYAVLHDDWPHYQQTWELVAFTASFCVIAAVLNLFPFLSEDGGYSDGARILQIVTKSPLDEYHRTLASITSTATTQRRYRDLDVAAIQRAASLFPGEFRGLHLNLCACHCFEDTNRFAEAAASLASAEAIYDGFAIELPGPLHTVFVIGHAFLNRDAAAARVWWDRMETKKNERKNVDYWLAMTALRWIEGDAKAAEEAWYEADSLAQSFPKFGAYEFDRFRCFLLRQALNESTIPVEIVSTPAAIGQPLPGLTDDDEAASSPILPAWITPLQVAERNADNETVADGGKLGLFARLASMTARPVAASPQASDYLADPLSRIFSAVSLPAPRTTEIDAERIAASGTVASAAQSTSAASSAGEVNASGIGQADPLACILLATDRNLRDLLSRPEAPLPALAPMVSAASSAPPLNDSPAITPLPMNAWGAMAPLPSTSEALTSFSPAQAQTPTKGPSVPAAFARRPRVTAPVPDYQFSVPAIADVAQIEPALVSVPFAERVAATIVAAEAAAAAGEDVASSVPVAETIAITPEIMIAANEVVGPPVEVTTPAPPPVEVPRFDALAFIRAAAIENLSTS
jgi:Zn-dependent protease